MFPTDMVCLRNISVDTLHKGDTEDDDDDNNNNNNNNNDNPSLEDGNRTNSRNVVYIKNWHNHLPF